MDIKAGMFTVAVLLTTAAAAPSAVVWSDEFEGPDIDTGTWTWDVGGWGFGNGQFEYNTSRAKNSYIQDGHLVIEAFREDFFGNSFTSARLLTQGRFAFKYGTLEARIKMPNTANGLWPAFWMLGNNFPGIDWPACGEIDIVEMGSKEGIAAGAQRERLNSALHYSNAAEAYESVVGWIDASDYIGTDDLSADFHRYKVAWTPTALTFYLDDAPFASWDITAAHFAEFHQPHFPVLNLAIGGWDPSYTGVYSPAAVTATFPARMRVDWIRLEENVFTEVYRGADTEETGPFGVMTETTPVNSSLPYGDDSAPGWPYSDAAALYLWENTMAPAAVPETPSEGSECWSFDIGSAGWYGMGVFLPNFRNMRNYSDGYLHFDINTTITQGISVGLKSSRGGTYWLPVGDETSDPGFLRDGNWHTVSVPLNLFANTDFNTIHQMFMITGNAPAGEMLSIDDVWWEPGAARPKPTGGSFGVFTETATNKTAGEYELGVDGEFFVWGDTLNPAAQTPYEGSESLSFTSVPGLEWFGAAFTPTIKYNLEAFDHPDASLRFAMRTSSAVTFYVGMKSGNVIGPDSPWGANTGPAGVGQVWIKFTPGSDPYGFARDGQWHAVEIPIADIARDLDLSEVSQLFQILGVNGPISGIELDDIYFAGGAALETNLVLAVVQDGVGITWPSSAGTSYVVEWTDGQSSNRVWSPLGPPVDGDGTTKTVFDPLGMNPERMYRILQLP